MDKCNGDDELENGCEYCKHLLKNVQKSIFSPDTIAQVEKYPQLTSIFQEVCEWFHIDCAININGLRILQNILSFELQDKSIEQFCKIFKQC